MNRLKKVFNAVFLNVLQTKRIFCFTFWIYTIFTISGTQTETYIQLAIPYLPMWLAAICLIMNVLLPGTGKPKTKYSITCSRKRPLWPYSGGTKGLQRRVPVPFGASSFIFMQFSPKCCQIIGGCTPWSWRFPSWKS